MNTQGRETLFRLEEKSSLVGTLEVQGCKSTGTDGALKVTNGSIMVLKVGRMVNLYKVIESVVIDDASVTEKKDATRLWHMLLGYMSERGFQANTAKEFYQVLNIANSTYISFAL